MELRTFVEAQGRQTRTFTTELRALGGGGMGAGDEFALVGYAAKFDSLSKDLGGFKEKIQPGAFARSLREKADVKALFNHASDNILGRTRSGTLVLNEDAEGLCFRCQLNPRSQYHRDLYESVKRGDISECSFAFTVPVGGDQWTSGIDSDTGKEISMRTLVDVDLMDVSIVTYPAYDDTGVAARSQKVGYGKKEAVSSSDLNFQVEMLRKAARSMGKHLIALAERDCSFCAGAGDDIYSSKSLRGHLEVCSQMLECSSSIADTIEGIMSAWPDEEEDDSLRKMGPKTKAKGRKMIRELHREFHRAMGEICNSHARIRHLGAGQIFD